eukprot:1500068-Pyramimonas_sp.AAC.1
MHCCVGPPPPETGFGQLQDTISTAFQYPPLKVSSAIAHRAWIEGPSSGHAKEYIPVFVFFTFPPYSGSEGRIWHPPRSE